MRDDQQIINEALAERLEAFGRSLTRTRNQAKSWRAQSGIEIEWDRADDAYRGVDDANRGSVARKPVSDGGALSYSTRQSNRSTVLLNITRPYVDAAAARIGDMLLPVDDRPWSIDPTPVPSMGQQQQAFADQSILSPKQSAGNLGPVPHQGAGMSPEGMQMPPGMPQQGLPGMLGAPAKPAELPAVMLARKAAEGAEKQIEDWLVECQWHGEMRKVFDDAARLGTGCIKGPVPVHRSSRKVQMIDGNVSIKIETKIAPESRHVPIRNVFPDPGCGNDIQNGSYVWEVDRVSAKQLRELKGLPGYLESQIDKVLELGPGSAKSDTKQVCNDDSRFEIWYYVGSAEREDLEAAQVKLDGVKDAMLSVPCLCALVEDVVIQAALAPLDSGALPYDFLPWQKSEGLPWGIGVAAQIETPQRGLTAALRNLMDNAGVSAGAQVVMNRSSITPADGRWELAGGVKFWWLNDGADVNEVRKAFEVYTIPSMQQELQAIIQFFTKAAEDTTGIIQMMQGQMGVNSPETFGGQVMLMNNAGAFLRRIARMADDMVTERHIGRYYEWLLLYGEDDSIKGDFQVNARGSTAMVELAMNDQFILQMAQMAANPAFGLDPEKVLVELLKAQKMDPERFLLDDEKKQQMAQQQPPAPPQIEVAKINAESRQQIAQADAQLKQALAQMDAQVKQAIAQMQNQASVEKMRMDIDRDATYVQSQTARDQTNAQAKYAELQIKRELAMLDYANREKVSLDSIKADLAKEAMKIQSVERLAAVKAPADLMPKPPIEPPGKAAPGESWQQ